MIKFSIERDRLLKALMLVSGAVEKRTTLPVLSNVLFDITDNQLLLSGTDTEIELQYTLEVTSVEQPGKITIPAKKLIDICRSLNDGTEIKFSQQGEKVVIASGRSRFNLTTLPADDFPSAKDECPDLEFQIERQALIHVLQYSHFAMANQDVRYYLNGLLIEIIGDALYCVSTDGHRLAIAELKLEQEIQTSKMILPRKGCLEMIRLINDVEDEFVLIQQTENHFLLKTKNTQFVSKLVSGKFPHYRRVIPTDNDKHFLVDRDLLKKTLSRVSILANEKCRAVTFNVSSCKVLISAVNNEQEEAQEELEVDTQGDTISVGINASYVMDVLNTVPPGLVKFSFTEPKRSILIEAASLPSAQYVVMPLKI